MRPGALLFLIAIAGCALGGCGPPERTARLDIATFAIDGIEPEGTPRIEPADALVSIARRGPLRWEAIVRVGAPLAVIAEGACRASLASVEPAAPATERFVRLAPLFEVEGERAQVGYGGRFELRAVAGCEEAERAEVEWSALEPSTLALEASERRRVVRGAMPTIDEAGVVMPARGAVAISPRTRGTRRVRLTISMPDRATWSRDVEVHAAARATGMPSIATGARAHLAGTGLTVVDRPLGAQPTLEPAGATTIFTADQRGRYAIRTESGETFTIFAGSHVATDLDCGRAECHASTVEHAGESPMATVFARLIASEGYTPGCAVACHAAGEPGLDDGGMLHVARELRVALPRHGGEHEHASMPRELRRLAGVTCTTCHGPGAIPEPGARARILRADVCAVCHDAPPRYGHVAAWRAGEMAQVDPDPALREDPCARCHTTEGYLGIEVLERTAEITCVACHAPHAAEHGPALTRRPAIDPAITEAAMIEGSSRACAACHGIDRALDLPAASAVALVTGHFAFGADGNELRAAAPHGGLERGCLSCHGSAGAGAAGALERGGDHAFGVARDVCAQCHDRALDAPADLAARIASLADRVGDVSRGAARPGTPASAGERARWNAALLANDDGAWAHAGRGAIDILRAAEALLAATDPMRDPISD
jgi:hypothetical protein